MESPPRRGHGFGVERTGKNAQPAKQLLFLRREQLIAALDGGGQGALMGRQVQMAVAEQIQALDVQPGQKLREGEQIHTRRAQFDGQGQTIQQTTDGRDGRLILRSQLKVVVHRLGALDK